MKGWSGVSNEFCFVLSSVIFTEITIFNPIRVEGSKYHTLSICRITVTPSIVIVSFKHFFLNLNDRVLLVST